VKKKIAKVIAEAISDMAPPDQNHPLGLGEDGIEDISNVAAEALNSQFDIIHVSDRQLVLNMLDVDDALNNEESKIFDILVRKVKEHLEKDQ
jgi:hypothetical protein